MDTGHLRFSVGALDCIAVSDGALVGGPPDDPPPASVLFANAPQAEIEAALEEAGETLPWMQWTEEITCLLVDAGGQRILIDAVIISHGHPDHIGGLVTSDGALAFPAARVFLSKTEWEFWMGGEAERVLPAEVAAMLVGFACKTLPLIEDRVELIDEEAELFPGVRCLPTPGHTPGHLALELCSRSEQLLVVADAILHPLHVEHPEWHSAFDADPVRLAQTRRALFAKAAAEACLVHAFHFPFPGLGRVSAHDSGWRWTSIS